MRIMATLGKIGLLVAGALFGGFLPSASAVTITEDTETQSIFTLQSASGAVTVGKSALYNNTAFFFSLDGQQKPTTTTEPLNALGLITPWLYKEDANSAGATSSGYDIQFLENTAGDYT